MGIEVPHIEGGNIEDKVRELLEHRVQRAMLDGEVNSNDAHSAVE